MRVVTNRRVISYTDCTRPRAVWHLGIFVAEPVSVLCPDMARVRPYREPCLSVLDMRARRATGRIARHWFAGTGAQFSWTGETVSYYSTAVDTVRGLLKDPPTETHQSVLASVSSHVPSDIVQI